MWGEIVRMSACVCVCLSERRKNEKLHGELSSVTKGTTQGYNEWHFIGGQRIFQLFNIETVLSGQILFRSSHCSVTI